MSLFVLDTAGDTNLLERESHGTATIESKSQWRTLEEGVRQGLEAINQEVEVDDNDEEEDYFGLPPPNVDISEIIKEELAKIQTPKSDIEEKLDKLSDRIDTILLQMKEKPIKIPRRGHNKMDFSDYNPATGKFDVEHQVKTDVEKEMAKSQLVAGFGRLKELPFVTKKKQREINRVKNIQCIKLYYTLQNDDIFDILSRNLYEAVVAFTHCLKKISSQRLVHNLQAKQ
uniref:Plasma membrane fusion protein prm1 n=1 Tax=Zeugodacus cucurbitae TaxID=28588 RepID=A0A0A1XK50_ZEUCU